MKSSIFGIVGAALATFVWLAVEHNLRQEFPWAAVLVGIVTGCAIHASVTSGSGESLKRGVMAAALALVACVGGRFLYVAYMAKSIDEPGQIVAMREAVDETQTEETSMEPMPDTGTTLEVTGIQSRQIPPDSMEIGELGKPTKRGDMSRGDLAWLSISAVLAYVLAKGAGNSEASSDEQPTEPAEG